MHHALRSSLAIVALVACAGCQTPDRRIYSIHPEKNVRVPSPWTPSTTKAADEATSPLGAPDMPPALDNSAVPASSTSGTPQ